MRHYKTVEVQAKQLTSITCNKCGVVHLIDAESANVPVHQFQVEFQYGSIHDGEKWIFDLCEQCIEKITGNFKKGVDHTCTT